MSILMKCKIVLTDMFSREFAQDCVDENDTVRDDQVSIFLKKKHLPNNMTPNLISTYFEIIVFPIVLLRLKISSWKKTPKTKRCDNFKRNVSNPQKCTRCLKLFHVRCFGIGSICYCCENVPKEGLSCRDVYILS